MEENSISIINRTNGSLTGEKAQALPIQIKGQWKWTRYVLVGVVLTIIAVFILLSTITKNVVAVEVSGKSDNFQVFQIQ